MIYKTLIGIGILVAGGIGLYNINNVEMYVAPEVEEIIEEVEETYPEEVLQDALEAQKRVLRVFDLEQDRVRIVEEMEAKKAEYGLYVKEQSGVIDTIDIELKTY